jgi:tight adherence protein B
MRKAVLAALAVVALALPAGAGAAGGVEIRRIDLDTFPQVRVTAVVPPGSRPTLAEDGRPASFVNVHDLGSAQAMVLAVDNSASMAGDPLLQAKRAAEEFLAGQDRAGATGLVGFGHEALALTQPRAAKSEVARALRSLSPDTQRGTSLYDAVALSVSRLQRMSNRTRILVVLTDGRDVGSSRSLSEAIAAAQRANVTVYAIAAGAAADGKPLGALASATGGKLFDAANTAGLGATYRRLSGELNRTWQLSYLSDAHAGDRVVLTVRVAGSASSRTVNIPQQGSEGLLSLIPASIIDSGLTAVAVALLAALLLALAVALGRRSGRESEISRLLKAHVTPRDPGDEPPSFRARFESLFDWTERSLDDLPGSERLTRSLERSGLKLRRGQVPYLALLAAFVFGAIGTIVGAPPPLALVLMLAGLASPFVALAIVAQRRTKAFDRQLPDVLSTIASTLRAGHGLRQALRAIADDSAAPASEEFARALGEERLGLPLDQAINAMCERIGSADLEYVATAVNVQSQTGGSLAGLFDTLSETVRERQRHNRKVHALTALGRISAIVLVGLPVGLALLMTLISPPYMAPLYTTSTGHVVIGVCLASMAVGALFLKRIVSVRY